MLQSQLRNQTSSWIRQEWNYILINQKQRMLAPGDRRGRDRMVVGFITTYCDFELSEVYSIQHYMI